MSCNQRHRFKAPAIAAQSSHSTVSPGEGYTVQLLPVSQASWTSHVLDITLGPSFNKGSTLSSNATMLASQRVVQVCLFLVAAIAMVGGALQMYLGEPETMPRLDNVHRFMAGVYFSTGLINLWAAITIRRQGTLVYLLALGVLLAGTGRLVSISQVGLPKPAAVWLGYLIPELLLPFVIAAAHLSTNRHASQVAPRA